MAKLASGKRRMLFFRDLDDRETEDGAKLRFQTEHSVSLNKDNESTTTKEGTFNSLSDGSNTMSISSMAYHEDGDTKEVWRVLKEKMKAEKLMEIWDVDMASAVAGQSLDIDYYQGYFTAFEETAGASTVALSMTVAIEGMGVTGTDTLTEEQIGAVEAAAYEYNSIKKSGGGE